MVKNQVEIEAMIADMIKDLNIPEIRGLIEANQSTIEAQLEMIKAQGAMIEELRQDARRELLELAGTLTDAAARIETLETEVEALNGALNGFEADEERGVEGDDESDEHRATRVGLAVRVGELEGVLKGRNRSAPVKRNMTDDDARRVLVGDVKDLGHKEAGDAIGLTYAQVYSCRLEYTFKHVHKELRDGGWKNGFLKSRK